jgi:NAD(P)-dependent dehydrogenase (short-subunit alcohol dehydrogenase family)
VSFRPDLLAGRRIVLAGGADGGALVALGAWVTRFETDLGLDPDADRAVDWIRDQAPLHALVCDTREQFAGGGDERLQRALALAWSAARAAATGAMIEAGQPGRLIFVAPVPAAGPLAQSLRAALCNLARTLSVEWARHGLTAVAIAPGAASTEAELAELVAFLISDAGGYLSGCELELGAVAVSGLIHRS